jgi:hypothetical protein
LHSAYWCLVGTDFEENIIWSLVLYIYKFDYLLGEVLNFFLNSKTFKCNSNFFQLMAIRVYGLRLWKYIQFQVWLGFKVMISKVLISFKSIWMSSSSFPMHHKLSQILQKDNKKILKYIFHMPIMQGYVCGQKRI